MKNSNQPFKKTIRGRFFRKLLFVTTAFLGIIALLYFFIHNRNIELENEQKLLMDKAVVVNALAETFKDAFFEARGYYAYKNEEDLQQVYVDLQKIEMYLKRFANMELTTEEQGLYQELQNYLLLYENDILPEAVAYVAQSDYEALRALSTERMNAIVTKVIEDTTQYKRKTDAELTLLFEKNLRYGQNAFLLSIIMSVGIIFFIMFIMKRVLDHLIRPIEQLTDATNAFAQGQSFDTTNIEKLDDELGLLTNAFINMTLSIQDKEEELTTQNEELLTQQDELQENQLKLQNSLQQLEKFSELNDVLTFTLDKQQLMDHLLRYLAEIYHFDRSLLTWFDGEVVAARGLAKQEAQQLTDAFIAKQKLRLEMEPLFIIKREVPASERGIANETYYAYDLYCAVVDANNKVIGLLMATREGHPYMDKEKNELQGLLKTVSIAFERILMYEQVERSRQLNRNIVENMSEGMQLVSHTGDLVLMNEALKAMMQLENGHKMHKEAWLTHFTQLVVEEEQLEDFFIHCIEESFKDTRTLRYSLKGEKPTFIEVYATSLYEGNEKTGTIFVHRNITREYEIDKMKSELVSTVSHELRTPLSSVLGFTELLLTKTLKPERQQKYIETIHKEAQRLTNLINDFLDLQRMESGRQQYTMKTVQVHEVAMEVIQRFRHEKNHHVHLIDKARNVTVKADEDRLVQVFVNMISNAIKFSPNGGDVTVALENKGDFLQVAIKDEGLGIAQEDIAQLFQKFKRIDNSARRKIGGTGLGLAICREIITMHNGEVWIESEEGKGTTVFFTLPLDEEISPIFEQNVMNIEQQSANVMIVEDDASLALLLSEEIKSKGFTVIYHSNPRRAYEEALKTPFIGIVVDLMLGDEMSGWDLIKLLKENEETASIPIVISSALDEVKELVEQYHVEKYLTKPYPPEEISNVLVSFISAMENKGAILYPKQEE